MSHKITIIVPAYNVEKYIRRCIDSILCSTYQNIEVIAIDDGSSDLTGIILDSYLTDNRVTVIHQANQGLVRTREIGIKNATGQYITFVDGDDAIEPDMYEKLVHNAVKYNADISHCGLCVFWSPGQTELHYGTGKLLIQTNTEALQALLDGQIFDASLCTKLCKKELFHNSCLDETIQSNEDLLRDFVLFKRAKTIVFEDFCGYQYWSRADSMSSMSNHTQIVKNNRQIIKARQIILENADPSIHAHALRLLLSTYIGVITQNLSNKHPQVISLCQACRNELKKNKRHFNCLIKRQQYAARLILYAPFLHKFIYSIYKRR